MKLNVALSPHLEARMSWLKQEIDKGLASSPSEPVSREYWERLRGQLRNYPA